MNETVEFIEVKSGNKIQRIEATILEETLFELSEKHKNKPITVTFKSMTEKDFRKKRYQITG